MLVNSDGSLVERNIFELGGNFIIIMKDFRRMIDFVKGVGKGCFFLSGCFFRNIHNSKDNRGRRRLFL